jgi:hypothetical protein
MMVQNGSVTGQIRLLRCVNAAERDLAARLIWSRYFRDLLELARNHLDRRIRRREDEEDVLQSMYKSFCLRQQRGEFDLAGRDALWNLLVTITLRKARNAAKKQMRDKRDDGEGSRRCPLSPAECEPPDHHLAARSPSFAATSGSTTTWRDSWITIRRKPTKSVRLLLVTARWFETHEAIRS